MAREKRTKRKRGVCVYGLRKKKEIRKKALARAAARGRETSAENPLWPRGVVSRLIGIQSVRLIV